MVVRGFQKRVLLYSTKMVYSRKIGEIIDQKILYITYDGLLEPLGQSQVLRYMVRLSPLHDIILVSFEKKEDWNDLKRRKLLAADIARAGIYWIPLRYHKRPSSLATAFDIGMGCAVAALLTVKHRIAIVHSRSYVASIPALLLKVLFGVRFIFDMRGFWADERVERGIWPSHNRMYRVAKWFERKFFCNADVVVSLTRAGVDQIRRFDYLKNDVPECEVITTCTDLNVFFPKGECYSSRPFTLGYVGSTDTAYLFEPVLECFRYLLTRKPDARMLIISKNTHGQIHALIDSYGISTERVEIKSAHHDAVAQEMRRMDASIFFVKTGFAVTASMPTKLGEFLASGIPCMCNAGVGDVADILEGDNVGVVLHDFSSDTLRCAVDRLLALVEDKSTATRCRATAEKRFSLQRGVESYSRIYVNLQQK